MPTFADAKRLALENIEFNPTSVRTLWFEDDSVLRLIHVDRSTLPSPDSVQVFGFAPNSEEGLDSPLEVAVVRPEEVGKAELPEGWGDWKRAKIVYDALEKAA